MQIVSKISLAFVEWQNARGTTSEITAKNNYWRLRKLVKKKIDERQTEYWDAVCEGIEKPIKLNDLATTFAAIRRLRGLTVYNDEESISTIFLMYPSNLDQDLMNNIEEKRQNIFPTIQEIKTAF